MCAVLLLVGCESENAGSARNKNSDDVLTHQESPMPTHELSPQEVVKIQLNALKENDEHDNGIKKVFDFASPENKTSTGPLHVFTQMVKNPFYCPMLNYETDELGPMIVEGNKARQRVVVIGPDGKAATYVFHLSKQQSGTYAGCWMTDGVERDDVQRSETFSSDQRSQRLDSLFELLKTSTYPTERDAIETMIWDCWMDSGDPEINALMEQGTQAMALRNYSRAISTFTKIIKEKPDFAEGWNKRATAYYLRGNFKSSVEDIKRTLELQKRHFGALSGLGLIYTAIGDDRAALKAFEAVMEIHPNQSGLRERVNELRAKIGIRRI